MSYKLKPEMVLFDVGGTLFTDANLYKSSVSLISHDGEVTF